MKSSLFLLLRRLKPYVPSDLRRKFWNSRILQRWAFGDTYGLNGLDAEIRREILQDNPPKFFVELGANDGIAQSNTKFLELHHKWTGLLVEADPKSFSLIRETRNRATYALNYAVVASPTEELVEFWASGLMTIAKDAQVGIHSDIENAEAHARLGRKVQEINLTKSDVSFRSPARTLTQCLEEAGMPSEMGLLSLDVEGMELAVLEGLRHDKFRFSYIVVESRNPKRIQDYLARQNYELVRSLSHHDYLFRDMLCKTERPKSATQMRYEAPDEEIS